MVSGGELGEELTASVWFVEDAMVDDSDMIVWLNGWTTFGDVCAG